MRTGTLLVCAVTAIAIFCFATSGKAKDKEKKDPKAPTVYIQPSVNHDAAKDVAHIKPDKDNKGSAKFTAKVSDAPAPHAEAIINGPSYKWSLSAGDGVSMAPSIGDSTDVTISGDKAWGKTYSLSVTVTWTDDKGAVAGSCSDSISINAAKK